MGQNLQLRKLKTKAKALDIASKGVGLVPQVVQAASQLAGLF